MPLPYFLYLSCEILRQKIPLTKSKRCLVQNDRFKDPVQKEKQQKKKQPSVWNLKKKVKKKSSFPMQTKEGRVFYYTARHRISECNGLAFGYVLPLNR